MATLKDIARKSGFSVSTVCYALNNDHRIPETTRNEILKIANDLHYKTKSETRSVTEYQKTIILCLNSMNGIIYSELYDSIHRVLHISNCKVLIYLGKDITHLRFMDGLILLNPNVKDKDIREVVARKIPVVVMDRESDVPGVSSVILDNFNGLYQLTQMVISKGAKTFAFVSGPENSIESLKRFQGFRSALSENKISFDEDRHLHGDFTYDSGYIVAETAFIHSRLPDAIICANDEMAEGIRQALIDYSIDFSKTIFTGFDGSANKKFVGLITCKYNRAHWGSVVAYVLTQMFSKIKPERIKIIVDITEY